MRTDLAEQLQAIHVAIFPLAVIRHLKKIWLFLLSANPQTGYKPRLIYNFSWIGINQIAKAAAHKDVGPFAKALHRLLGCILAADPALGPAYLFKFDIADAYMRIWVREEEVPSVVFLIPN